ncbi:MAG: hypothetical protein KGY99_08965 [Phycisphaerae bacterium]|nr:hypothetical protein [Phycisphaerae bacterium]
MAPWHWVLIIIGGVILIEIILALIGIGGLLMWLWTGVYHAFKSDPLPGVNDDNWSRDQGRDVK